MRVSKLLVSQAVAALLAVSGAFAERALADVTEVRVYAYTIHLTKPPRNLVDLTREIANNPVASSVVEGIATSYGVPPEAVQAVFLAAKFTKSGGEESWFTLPVDDGFVVCDAEFDDVSRNGRGAIGIVKRRSHLDVYTWLQRRGIGQGRSWVETNVRIEAVPRSEARDADCRSDGEVLFQRKW